MKVRIFLLLFIFFSLEGYSQEQTLYQLNKEIHLITIEFSKSLPNVFSINQKKQLTGISFFLTSEKDCYLKKHYNTDKKGNYARHDLGDKIDISIYYQIVEKINNLYLDNINYDFNIADGISYFLYFGDGKYSINLSAHTVGENDRSDATLDEFLDVFDFVWDLVEE